MALVLYEPFEIWPSPYLLNHSGPSPALVSGISGMDGLCLDLTALSTDYISLELPSSLSTIYMSFLVRFTTIYTYGHEMLTFRDSSGNIQGMLKRNGTSYLEAYRGWGAALLGTSTNQLLYNNTKRIDVKYTPHDTAGVFQVWMDDTLEIDVTTGNTTDYSGDVARLQFGDQQGHLDYPYLYLDCLAVDDAAIPGLIKAKVLLPNAAGYTAGLSQFPNSGNPYEKVDDKGPPVDINLADCLHGNTADLIHAFDLETLAATGIDEIKAIIAQSIAHKEGSPTPTGQQVGVRSGGSNYFSSTLTTTAAQKVAKKMWLVDPADSNPLTPTKVNAMELLGKLVA